MMRLMIADANLRLNKYQYTMANLKEQLEQTVTSGHIERLATTTKTISQRHARKRKIKLQTTQTSESKRQQSPSGQSRCPLSTAVHNIPQKASTITQMTLFSQNSLHPQKEHLEPQDFPQRPKKASDKLLYHRPEEDENKSSRGPQKPQKGPEYHHPTSRQSSNYGYCRQITIWKNYQKTNISQ